MAWSWFIIWNRSEAGVSSYSSTLGGCPFNGPLSVMEYPTRGSPRRDAASPINYNGLRSHNQVASLSSNLWVAEQQSVGPRVALIFKSIIILLIIFIRFIKSRP